MLYALMSAGGTLLSGCAGLSYGAPASVTGTEGQSVGTRGLLSPAIKWSAGQHGLAYVGEEEQPDGSVYFELVSVRDEPGWIRATPGDDDAWMFTAQIGRFGDAEREAALLETLNERIEAMREAGY